MDDTLKLKIAEALAQDPRGFPIDRTRPEVPMEGGNYGTEYSMTHQLPDGRWQNTPTIWGGKVLDPRTQYDQIMQNMQQDQARGWTFPNFDTLSEAENAAVERSRYLGANRGFVR